jgi:ribonuclease BN (tRNA processing enzyme)
LRLTIIGSGSAVPQRKRAAPCCLIGHEDESAVVDLGPGAVRGILTAGGAAVREVRLILITHFHPDHCSDRAPFLFALRSPEMDRRETLKILGPQGMKDH